jgi:pyrimidine operon attenuation protein/uracil phosphoribosyltransferase
MKSILFDCDIVSNIAIENTNTTMHQTILNSEDILRKIKRMAIEIAEQNNSETEIVLLGIYDRGLVIAELIKEQLLLENIIVELGSIKLNKKNPLDSIIELNINSDINNKVIIIVDDVANSGMTLFYAQKPLMNKSIKKLQVAVLVDRQHKSFPITPDYVGLSISTTLKNMIHVEIDSEAKLSTAYLA